MRHKNEDMVFFDKNKLLELTDLPSLNRLTRAMGLSRQYMSNAIGRERIPKQTLEAICRFYDTDPAKIIRQEKPKDDDAVLELLVEQEKKFDEQIERLRVKTDRDMAELRSLITSLQSQIQQLRAISGEGRIA